jgi:hypothetical protein
VPAPAAAAAAAPVPARPIRTPRLSVDPDRHVSDVWLSAHR